MAIRQVRTAKRRYGGWLLMIIATGYFAYHSVYGGYGLLSMDDMRADKARLEAELSRYEKERSDLEHKVSLLRPESLDPDMLDERARALLNNAQPNDIVITVD